MFNIPDWVYTLIWVIASSTAILWTYWRYDYRRFQKYYKIKLPFICTVTLTKKPDKIIWGNTRYRFITKDGKKDNRYGWNFKYPYPTIIIVCRFQVKIWSLKEARRVFRDIEPCMDLNLAEVPFQGPIEGDLYSYFNGNHVLFVRYCLKLLAFYGWQVELCGYGKQNGLARNGQKMYAIHCVFRESPIVINDLSRLPKTAVDVQWIIIGNGKASNEARKFSCQHNILIMDRECIRKTFVYEEPRFL